MKVIVQYRTRQDVIILAKSSGTEMTTCVRLAAILIQSWQKIFVGTRPQWRDYPHNTNYDYFRQLSDLVKVNELKMGPDQ